MKRSLSFVAAALVLAACADSPAEPAATPKAAATALRRNVDAATASKMATIGEDLVDATDAFVVVLDDEPRAVLRAAISTLADALIAGDAAAATTRLEAARAIIAAQSEDMVHELAPVSLAFDNVESVLASTR